MRKSLLIALIPLPLCLLAAAPAAPGDGANSNAPGVEPAQVKDGVRSIPTLPVVWPEMPAGPNKDIYLANCVTCHTQRYVLMQPNFTKKVWTAEVLKMKKTYGAMMDDKVMPQIVDYLMAVRGKDDAAAKQ